MVPFSVFSLLSVIYKANHANMSDIDEVQHMKETEGKEHMQTSQKGDIENIFEGNNMILILPNA